jgi:hypothetical protein
LDILFRENTGHNQASMIESTYWMNPRIKEKLQKSWAPIYYEHVFCKIDENPFAVLYSDVGRPNFPVNIAISLEFIKHFLNLSDDELIDNFYFNYLVNYAVGIRVLGELNLAERTMYEFRDRIYRHTLEHPTQEDLIFGHFIELVSSFAETAGISMDEQRMDSTMFMSNIKKAGRLSLAFDVLIKAIKAIPDANQTDNLKSVLNPEFRTEMLFKTKASETESKLTIVLNLCKEAQEILKNLNVKKSEEALRIATRFLSEQAELDSETNRLVARNSKDIPSNSLQSAYDEDATYRNKNGKGQSGFVANLAETCNKENPFQLITDYTIDQNIKSDVEFIKERLPQIKENTGCKKLYTDGGYYSEKISDNNSGVEVNFTDMTGREPSSKIPVTDFDICSKTHVIKQCPNNFKPIHASYTKEQSVAHFPLDACNNCEFRDRCPAKKQKKSYVVRISKKSLEAAIQRLKIDINRRQNVSMRAGIEGTNSALKRGHGMDKLYVRSKAKCTVVAGLKITAQNIRRFVKYLQQAFNKLKPNINGITMPSPA